ncbi:F0F1 ATP synthase subunit delta [Roseovarius salinarum]|uniref:F0F1 ATP synthase subunit delta n=1 Tax=Roseovarius salinarum TaxID=1981892 RepID=UPI000C33A4FD|nr:F0F1 ATP synthase subunit delta [Roseovarius salinarum]
MQLDWLTVAAQIVNFLVLIWLLQRFLYTPITRAMAQRESRIESRMAEAREAREEARQKAEALDEERAELEADRDAQMRKAREEAEELRQRLEAEAREEVEKERAAWQEKLEVERAEALQDIRTRMSRQVLKVTRQVLGELADADLADRLARVFVERLSALDDEARTRLQQAAADMSAPATVESAVELPAPVRARITRAIHETVAEDIEVSYRENADLVLGLRLGLGDQTVEWSAARHLDRVESAMAEALEAARAEAGTP